jgi:hypothetical protein
MRTFESIGIGVPQILLPRAGVPPETWAVVACDQYTSEPEYWARVAETVGAAPSTLKLIFPEVYLGAADADARIADIQAEMARYLADGILEEAEGFIYVERTAAGKRRRGLMVALDLDAYDYRAGSSSLVRATEGTIVERLPPRIRVRAGAPMELPHIMVLVDDPEHTVIEPLTAARAALTPVYDFELMEGGGHLAGLRVTDPGEEARIVAALEALAAPAAFRARYGLEGEAAVLLYAMGDGNHSLATAKAIWEEAKAHGTARPDDPRRYALVELVNLHDAALEFEPIHRVLFEVAPGLDPVASLGAFLDGGVEARAVGSLAALVEAVEAGGQRVGVITAAGYQVVELTQPKGNLPVASVQPWLDGLAQAKGFREVDYVHGTEVVGRLGARPGNVGLFLPGMDKHELFKTVILDGALPRKTFSMGEAEEKRFYMEGRRIG